MRLISVFCLIGILYSSLVTARNQHSSSPIDDSIGVSHTFSQPELFIYIDQNRILKNLHKLQKSGVIDANLSPTEADFYKIPLATTVSISYVAKIIHRLYFTTKDTNQINVKAYLITADLYGNNRAKSLCYSFNFNRALNQKINWNNFKINNLVQIAPDFKAFGVCRHLNETDSLNNQAIIN